MLGGTLSCHVCPILYPGTKYGIFRKIRQGKVEFETSPWPSISESAKDLIGKMLESNPQKRLTAHQVLCKQHLPFESTLLRMVYIIASV